MATFYTIENVTSPLLTIDKRFLLQYKTSTKYKHNKLTFNISAFGKFQFDKLKFDIPALYHQFSRCVSCHEPFGNGCIIYCSCEKKTNSDGWPRFCRSIIAKKWPDIASFVQHIDALCFGKGAKKTFMQVLPFFVFRFFF